nr:MSMEG_0568 family radical SAM protein [Desulfatitalea alkaliphila]
MTNPNDATLARTGDSPVIKEIVRDILSLGVRVPASVTGRKSGAGPAEGRALIIGGIAVNAPISSSYAALSPYSLRDDGDNYVLCREDQPLLPVDIVPEPRFYLHRNREGIAYRKIALLHGRDCLATTVLQSCRHWRKGEQCAFCGTELSLKAGTTLVRKTPSQLAEAAACAQRLDRVAHVVLTSGAGDPPGSEISYLAECAQAVKQATGLPVHAQFAPPDNLAAMEALYDAGVDTVGIHIESFDTGTLERFAPAKARIGLSRYRKAWEKAVALFGPNQVSSFLIVGLGEPLQSLMHGSELLADMGVYPFIVPLRPISGTRCIIPRPPGAGVMQPIYEGVADILAKRGLSAAGCKAGCVRCGACSALAAYERPPDDLIYHRARTPRELEHVFTIRHAVFVTEQGMFTDTDRDVHDEKSIYIVAKAGDRVVGTVRVFPQGTDNHWVGGRLAVSKGYRHGNVGAALVKEAVAQVKRQGCVRFTACIQEQNVRFFEKIGWTTIGKPKLHMGKPHQLMKADLNSQRKSEALQIQ